jgi:hypothetical protein
LRAFSGYPPHKNSLFISSQILALFIEKLPADHFLIHPSMEMFCPPLPLEPNKDIMTLPDASKAPSAWNVIIRSRTSEWARARGRIQTLRNVGGTHKNKWSVEQDAQLIAAVQKVGQISWTNVANLVPGRNGKQCRERWLDKLSPDLLKDDWSPEEDSILLAKQEELGHAWAKMKEFLPGRSMAAVKNRWNWLVRRDIPNHAEEFRAIAAEQTKKEKVVT